jgi:WD40 repeat protein
MIPSHLALVWEVATGRVAGSTLPHPSEIRTGAFSPDGKLILMGCRDGLARLWDFRTRQRLGTPLPQQGIVEKVAFVPDGQKFLTAGRNGILHQWTVPLAVTGGAAQVGAWVETITGLVLGPNDAAHIMTAEEWRRCRASSERMVGR